MTFREFVTHMRSALCEFPVSAFVTGVMLVVVPVAGLGPVLYRAGHDSVTVKWQAGEIERLEQKVAEQREDIRRLNARLEVLSVGR